MYFIDLEHGPVGIHNHFLLFIVLLQTHASGDQVLARCAQALWIASNWLLYLCRVLDLLTSGNIGNINFFIQRHGLKLWYPLCLQLESHHWHFLFSTSSTINSSVCKDFILAVMKLLYYHIGSRHSGRL